MEGPEGASAIDWICFCKSNMESLILELRSNPSYYREDRMYPIKPTPLGTKKYKDISGSVTTPRLDAVLSVAIRTSRTQGLQLIRDGNIY